MVNWFTQYKDVLAGIAGIATSVGLLATSVAITIAAIQIREQRRIARANAVYEVQRDARQFAQDLINDPVLATAVYGRQPDKGKTAIASVINFYSAVFQMWHHGILSERLWVSFAEDFMWMLEVEGGKEQWEAKKCHFDRHFVGDIERRLAHFKEK